MDVSVKFKDTPQIPEESWLSYFESLHTNESLNSDRQNVITELRELKARKMQSYPLDYFLQKLKYVQQCKNEENQGYVLSTARKEI